MTRTRTIIVASLCLFAGAGTPAVASKLLTGKDIRDGSLAERDLNAGVRGKLNASRTGPVGATGPRGLEGVQGPQGARGATGPQGEQGEPGNAGLRGSDGTDGRDGQDGRDGRDSTVPGPKGDTGPAGPSGVSGIHPARTAVVQLGDQATQTCPPGETVISGGYELRPMTQGDPLPDVQVVASMPTDDPHGGTAGNTWYVRVKTPEPIEISIVAYCAPNA